MIAIGIRDGYLASAEFDTPDEAVDPPNNIFDAPDVLNRSESVQMTRKISRDTILKALRDDGRSGAIRPKAELEVIVRERGLLMSGNEAIDSSRVSKDDVQNIKDRDGVEVVVFGKEEQSSMQNFDRSTRYSDPLNLHHSHAYSLTFIVPPRSLSVTSNSIK